MKQEVISTN